MTIPNALYPIFLQLQNRKTLVVGGGVVAERKIRALLSAQADVHVGAPQLTETLQHWARESRLTWHEGTFDAQWLDGAWLVVAATDDRQTNAHIRDLCTERHLWINVVDDPELSAFQVPAVVDRAPLTLAISSGGHAPVLARRMRERLETLVDHEMGTLAGMLAERRDAIRRAYPDLSQRRAFYDWTLDGPPLALLAQGDTAGATRSLDDALLQAAGWPRRMLTVLAAPATDPGLLTLKGLRALHAADALLFDPSMHDDAVLSMARRDAQRLPCAFDAWQTAEQADSTMSAVLEEYGRVVMLTSAGGDIAPHIGACLNAMQERGVHVESL